MRSGKKPAAASRAAKPDARAIEQVEGASAAVELKLDAGAVTLTHLDKVLWPALGGHPAYTRRDYIRYLLRMAPYLLAHLRDRPLTLIRQPTGATGRRFVHFHYEQALPAFVDTVDVYSEKAARAEPYLLCNNSATLVWLAHTGSLEFHAWHSRVSTAPDAKGAGTDYGSSVEALEKSILNFPDYIVCDLDPYIYAGVEAAGAQPEFSTAAFERCKEVAFALRRLLDGMGLEALVKTSGKTGLHVLVPVLRTISFAAARAFAETLGRHLMTQHPGLITMEPSTARRTGKIFFDYAMNARVKTLSVPYSVRGVAGAPVAMPLTWQQLEHASPLDFNLGNAAERVAAGGDLWRDMLEQKQDIVRALT